MQCMHYFADLADRYGLHGHAYFVTVAYGKHALIRICEQPPQVQGIFRASTG